jgi:Domain of unknown function (DUF4265)
VFSNDPRGTWWGLRVLVGQGRGNVRPVDDRLEVDDDGTASVRVVVYFESEEGGPSSETFWARKVADDVFVLRNVPFFAYDLNFGDAVRADREGLEIGLTVRDVVRRAGYQTLRIFFEDSCDVETQNRVTETLESMDASSERADARLVAVSVRPGGDYDSIFEYLSRLEAEGLLGFEEARGRADGHPEFSQ